MTCKKRVLFQVLYYVAVLLIDGGIFYGTEWLLQGHDLGSVVVAAYGLLFVILPATTAVMARFSLIQWYVDPFFALILPAFLSISIISDRMERFDISFFSAVSQFGETLCRDYGFLYVTLLFAFGLLCSLSFARKRCESLAYRLLLRKLK